MCQYREGWRLVHWLFIINIAYNIAAAVEMCKEHGECVSEQ